MDYVLLYPALRAGYQDSLIRKGQHFPHQQVVHPHPLRYTDPNLYFQIYNKDNLLPSGTNDCININNYRESLFEVLPTSSFEINDEMNSQKVEAKKAESKPRAKTEEEQFKAIITEKRGKNIAFGDKVIFRHVDSQYYINGSFDCASSGIGAFKIELKKELS